MFNAEDERKNSNIPITLIRKPDWFYQKYDATSNYTVMTGYNEPKKIESSQIKRNTNKGEGSKENQLAKYWNFLQKLQLKHKFKHFIWKCLNKNLPVNEVLASRVGIKDLKYCKCSENDESVEHMLFFCSESAIIWELPHLKWDGIAEARGGSLEMGECLIGTVDRNDI